MSAAICPTCNEKIPLRALRKRMSGLLLLSLPRPGIVCDRCGQQLALHTGRSGAAVAAAMAWLFGFVVFSGLGPPRASLLSLLLAGVPLFLAYRYAQALATVSMPKSGEDLFYFADAMKSLWHRTAGIRQRNEAERHDESERIREINASERKDWKCSKCFAENPSTFDVCWKCESQRVSQ